MTEKYSYTLGRNLLQVTSIIFFTQVIMEIAGVIDRKNEFGWVLLFFGLLFVASLVHNLTLIFLNIKISMREKNG
tara:strand:+ start:19856 stop:20080 length:225 start_codon:yes stop_codon:yes gene_type:complete